MRISQALRRTVLPVTVAVVSGLTTASIQHASTGPAAAQQPAAASCTLSVPAKFAIWQIWDLPAISRGADCTAAGVVDARWNAKRPDGTFRHQVIFRWDNGDGWSLYDNADLGLWSWTPAGALTAGDVTLAGKGSPAGDRQATSIPQNTPTTDIRLMSRSVVVASANTTKNQVTVTAIGTHYSPGHPDFVPHPSASGSLQWRAVGATNWTVLKSFTSNSSGQFSYTYTNPGKREYRAVFYDAPTIFGSISSGWVQ